MMLLILSNLLTSVVVHRYVIIVQICNYFAQICNFCAVCNYFQKFKSVQTVKGKFLLQFVLFWN